MSIPVQRLNACRTSGLGQGLLREDAEITAGVSQSRPEATHKSAGSGHMGLPGDAGKKRTARALVGRRR